MAKDKEEEEQFTPLGQVAALMNEIFLEFQVHGFTESQSLRLVGMIAAELMRDVED